MSLKLEDLLSGPKTVRIKGEHFTFNISVVEGTGGVIGVKAYNINSPRPAKNDHLLLRSSVRDNWFEDLELASEPILKNKRTSRKFIEFND